MNAVAAGPLELSTEDRARAYCYALVSRLFFGPPDRAFVDQMTATAAEDGETPLIQAWRDLAEACRSAQLDAVRQEYDDLFISVGKAPVTLYTAHYAAPQGPDRHLVTLREQLSAWGLARGEQVGETEDHVSGVCDVMRWLIETQHSEAEQRRFFFAFIDPAGSPLCAAATCAPDADFYKRVAHFAQTFFELEREAFNLIEEDER
jgi:TorA maturation chaperone TorD